MIYLSLIILMAAPNLILLFFKEGLSGLASSCPEVVTWVPGSPSLRFLGCVHRLCALEAVSSASRSKSGDMRYPFRIVWQKNSGTEGLKLGQHQEF